MGRSQRETLVKKVLQTGMAWVDGHRRPDTKTLKRLMAVDYFVISLNGSVADNVEALASYQSGEHQREFTERGQHEIQLYGQTAMLHGH